MPLHCVSPHPAPFFLLKCLQAQQQQARMAPAAANPQRVSTTTTLAQPTAAAARPAMMGQATRQPASELMDGAGATALYKRQHTNSATYASNSNRALMSHLTKVASSTRPSPTVGGADAMQLSPVYQQSAGAGGSRRYLQVW